ncbi:hypothetical protein OY671_012686, partial [Metschnikowia pulcherrima]
HRHRIGPVAGPGHGSGGSDHHANLPGLLVRQRLAVLQRGFAGCNGYRQDQCGGLRRRHGNRHQGQRWVLHRRQHLSPDDDGHLRPEQAGNIRRGHQWR